jgi:hypothetical protein
LSEALFEAQQGAPAFHELRVFGTSQEFLELAPHNWISFSDCLNLMIFVDSVYDALGTNAIDVARKAVIGNFLFRVVQAKDGLFQC